MLDFEILFYNLLWIFYNNFIHKCKSITKVYVQRSYNYVLKKLSYIGYAVCQLWIRSLASSCAMQIRSTKLAFLCCIDDQFQYCLQPSILAYLRLPDKSFHCTLLTA